jgi:hypothetical protein
MFNYVMSLQRLVAENACGIFQMPANSFEHEGAPQRQDEVAFAPLFSDSVLLFDP